MKLSRQRAKQIAEAGKGITNGFRLWNASELGFFRLRPFLEIPALHDYLTDAVDWHAETWDFERDGLERLARTFRWAYERLPEAFQFSATWGAVTIDERDISRAELLTVVEGNAISTGTVYRVSEA